LATFLVVHPYLDIYGGGEKVCHNVIKALILHGQKVELLTFDFDSERYRDIIGEEFPHEVTVHPLGARIEIKPPFALYKRRRYFAKSLKEYRNSLNYDYLFSTQSSPPFEPVFLNKAKKNIAYVHFPEIHFKYERASVKRKVYLWPFKKMVEQGVSKLDLIFCNSNYTKELLERYWKTGSKKYTVVYPPVNLNAFWCDKPLSERRKRVVYVARFAPIKNHETMKKLASELSSYEFVSVGALIKDEKSWFDRFSEDLPQNYNLRTNLPTPDLIDLYHDSRIYAHFMEGEHFGIAPVEGVASGCVTLTHNSGGMREFIPEEFRWENYADLKDKIVRYMESTDESLNWQKKRSELWSKISDLDPQNFQNNIWSYIQKLVS
jgi:glycosyltransferase involved in cell wall biosynthesis